MESQKGHCVGLHHKMFLRRISVSRESGTPTARVQMSHESDGQKVKVENDGGRERNRKEKKEKNDD